METSRENRDQRQRTATRERAPPDVADALARVPRSVNLHLDPRCNYRCRFCYFTEEGHLESIDPGSSGTLDHHQLLRLQTTLAQAGVERITYAGGEPTLRPDLEELVLHWHHLHESSAPRAMVVTNGTALHEGRLRKMQPALAAVKLSAESTDDAVEAALGRGFGNHIQLVIDRADTLRRLGTRVDLNSVICSLNWQEDLCSLVERIRPRYWKVFRFLPVPGQNDAGIDTLSITADQFTAFLDRHSHFERILVPEDNELMRGSYAMVDPIGRFFQSTPGGYVRGRHSVLEVGVKQALAEVSLDWTKYDSRGGDERAFGARRVA